MSLLRFLPTSIAHRIPRRTLRTGRLAVAFWDKELLNYLVVSYKPGQIKLISSQTVAHSDSANPLSALSEHLRERNISVRQLAVLLSRSDLEVLSLELPQSAASELPLLVQIAVEQQIGESDTPPIIDFFRVRREGLTTASDLESVLAYSLSQSRLDTISQEAEEAGFRLIGVTVRQLPSLSLLRTRATEAEPALVVSIQLYSGEAELAMCYKNYPLLMRSVRVNLEDCQRVAEQLSLEVERCMSLLPPAVEELSKHWLIDLSHDSAESLAEALRITTASDVKTVQAHLQSGSVRLKEYGINSPDTEHQSRDSATAGQSLIPTALAGASWEVANQKLDIDFWHPKRPPPPPNPWIRPALWGVGLAAAFILVGTVLLGDVWKLQSEVGELGRELAEAKKLQAKLQEKSDQVQTVENWLRDQVDWLSALSEVSERLPEGQNATVRRLNAAVNEGTASFDLSVQVLQPEDIAELENRLRSVKYTVSSKRISQSPEASEYPWKFETRVTFPVEPVAWNQYAETQLTGQSEISDDTASTEIIADKTQAKLADQEPSELRVDSRPVGDKPGQVDVSGEVEL